MEVTNKNPFSSVPKVVIFDLCGTILNSKEIDHEAINYTLHKFNKETWKITRQNKDPLKSMKDNFPNFFGKDAESAYNVYINYLIAKNYNRIYTANSHQEIAHCLIEGYKRHRMYKKINTQEMYNGNSNRK